MRYVPRAKNVTDLLELPVGAALYLAPDDWGGGAATNAELPGFRFRFRRLRSRADIAPKSTSGTEGALEVVGDGTFGVTERVVE